MIPFGAAHTYMAYIWEFPPPGGVQRELCDGVQSELCDDE